MTPQEKMMKMPKERRILRITGCWTHPREAGDMNYMSITVGEDFLRNQLIKQGFDLNKIQQQR